MRKQNVANSHRKLFDITYSEHNISLLFERIDSSEEPIVLVTPNVDHIVRIAQDPSIKILYQGADICLNDSRVLSLLVPLILKTDLPSLTGSDLTLALLQRHDIRKKKIAIVGCSKEQVASLSETYLKGSSVPIAHINPSWGFYKNPSEMLSIIEFVINTRADYIFLAVGSPQQEQLAMQIKRKLSKGTLLCIGASLDYLTGKEKRAPVWVQKMCLEWLYRFLQDPIKRFHRYFISCPKILWLIWQERHLRKLR